jgi:hypothetical protein
MRWFILLVLGASGLAASFGCSHVTYTEGDVAHHQRHAAEMEAKEFQEDVDTFLLMDRPSHLTRWHVER